MTHISNDDRREMLDLNKNAHAWIESLLVSGMDEKAVVAALCTACIERAVIAGGRTGAAWWLRSQADMLDQLADRRCEI